MCRNEESDPYFGVEYAPSLFDDPAYTGTEELPCGAVKARADGFWRDIRKIIGLCFQKQHSLYLMGGYAERNKREIYFNLWDFDAAVKVAHQLSKVDCVFPEQVNRVVYEFDPRFKIHPEEAPYVIELIEGKASGHTYYDLIISSVSGFEVIKCGYSLELRLMLREEPLLILTLLDCDCSIRHEHDGECFFTKRINRMMAHEAKFANLMAELFSLMAARACIYESVASCIKRDHTCQVPFTLKQFEKYYFESELINDNVPSWLIHKFCTNDMNYSFFLAELAKYIDEQDLSMLMEETYLIRTCLCSDDPLLKLVSWWYRMKFNCLYYEPIEEMVNMYIVRCRLNERKMRLARG